MRAFFVLTIAGLIALGAARPAVAGPAAAAEGVDGWPALIGPALVLRDVDEVAEIRVALARTAETVPALFRLTLSRAKAEIRTFRRDAGSDFEEFGDDPDFPWRPWSYDIVFEERYARAPLYSLLESKFTYTGGAHPNTDFAVVNFDARSQREFGLHDVFDDVSEGAPVLEALAAYTRRDLAAQKSERFGETIDVLDESLDVVTPAADTFRLFTLTPAASQPTAAGITVHFPPYAVGAYVEGSYEVFVPAEVFAEYLAPGYVDLFGGVPGTLEAFSNWNAPGALLLSETPRSGQAISSPLALSGEAPSHWFFEGVAGVEVFDEAGNSLGIGYVTWDPDAPTSGVAAGMVAYSGTVTFDPPASENGIVVVAEDDPSGGETGPVESVSIDVAFE